MKILSSLFGLVTLTATAQVEFVPDEAPRCIFTGTEQKVQIVVRNESNAADERNFAHAAARRIPAEQLLDSIYDTVHATFIGVVLISLINGIAIGFTFALLGLPAASSPDDELSASRGAERRRGDARPSP